MGGKLFLYSLGWRKNQITAGYTMSGRRIPMDADALRQPVQAAAPPGNAGLASLLRLTTCLVPPHLRAGMLRKRQLNHPRVVRRTFSRMAAYTDLDAMFFGGRHAIQNGKRRAKPSIDGNARALDQCGAWPCIRFVA